MLCGRRVRERARGGEEVKTCRATTVETPAGAVAARLCARGGAAKGCILQSCALRVVSQRDSKEHFLSFGQTSFARCEGVRWGQWGRRQASGVPKEA